MKKFLLSEKSKDSSKLLSFIQSQPTSVLTNTQTPGLAQCH